MFTAMLTVENIVKGTNHDIWSVNVEQEYHEEKGESGTGRGRSRAWADRDVTRPPTWFRWGLVGTMAAALVARFWYLAAVGRKLPVVGDAATYHLLARVLAAGEGYVRPRELLSSSGGRCPPPSSHRCTRSSWRLADLVGIDTPNGQRVVGACLGVLTVGLVGSAGPPDRRATGPVWWRPGWRP